MHCCHGLRSLWNNRSSEEAIGNGHFWMSLGAPWGEREERLDTKVAPTTFCWPNMKVWNRRSVERWYYIEFQYKCVCIYIYYLYLFISIYWIRLRAYYSSLILILVAWTMITKLISYIRLESNRNMCLRNGFADCIYRGRGRKGEKERG